jgi:hypothetical protein
MDVIVHRSRLKGFCGWLGGVGLALSPLALADGSPPSAHALGVAESVINYCGPIEPAATDRLRQKVKQLVQGASEQQLAEVRKSDEYRKAYDSVVDFVGKIDQHNAKQFCSQSALERK